MLANLEGRKVHEIMSVGVHSLSSETTVRDASRFFLDHGFSGAPIVDDGGKPIGVLTLHDLAEYLDRHLTIEEESDREMLQEELKEVREECGMSQIYLERLHEVRVEQIMTPRVLSVHDDLAADRAIRYMSGEGVHRLFVTDSSGALVGVLSTIDVVRALAARSDTA